MERDPRKGRISQIASRHYDFSTVRSMTRLTGGVLNEVYLAETSRGDFVIRVNRVRRSMDEIERLSDFLSHLDRSGIPVDGFVRTAGGQVAVAFDDELLSLHRCLPGTVYPSPADLTGSQKATMMRFLADYHAAAGRYRTNRGLAIRNESVPVIYTDDPDRLKGRFESLPHTTPVVESAVNGAIDRLAGFFPLDDTRNSPEPGSTAITGPATCRFTETVWAGCSTGT